MEYKVIEGGGITSPKGFYRGRCVRRREEPQVPEARCGRPLLRDRGLLRRGVHHQQVLRRPVILDREILKNGKARAIVINSGNANAATGTQGHRGRQDRRARGRELPRRGRERGLRLLHRRYRPEAARREGARWRPSDHPRQARQGQRLRRGLCHHDHRHCPQRNPPTSSSSPPAPSASARWPRAPA